MNIINNQPIEKRIDQDTLEVHSIFDTIQGEGPFAGTPAVFVRLAGCNLQCPACDTDYTSQRHTMTPVEVRDAIDRTTKRDRTLVVLTGGEPFRQSKALGKLIDLLFNEKMLTQVETNGTLNPTGSCSLSMSAAGTVVVCSPKTPNVQFQFAEAWKYILHADHVDAGDGLPLRSLDMAGRPARPPHWVRKRDIYVQPIDVQDEVENARHLAAAIETCREYGYRLCVQLHKSLGLE